MEYGYISLLMILLRRCQYQFMSVCVCARTCVFVNDDYSCSLVERGNKQKERRKEEERDGGGQKEREI